MKKILMLGILVVIALVSVGLVTAGNFLSTDSVTNERNNNCYEECDCICDGQGNCICEGEGNCICDGQCNAEQCCNQYINGNCLKNSNSNGCCKRS